MIEKDVVIDGNYKSILKSISYYHSDHYTDCSELYLGREWDLVVGLDGLSPSPVEMLKILSRINTNLITF